jgi:hypothetical protein
VGETLLLHPSVLTYQDGNIDDILVVQMYYTVEKNYIDNNERKSKRGQNNDEKMGGKNGECSDNLIHTAVIDNGRKDNDDYQIDSKVVKKNKKIKKNDISLSKSTNLNTNNNKKNIYVSTTTAFSTVRIYIYMYIYMHIYVYKHVISYFAYL